MDFIIWMAQMAWRVILIGAGFYIFGAVLKNGPGTMMEIIRTIGAGIRVGCIAARKKMANYLRKEASTQKEEDDNSVEARIV